MLPTAAIDWLPWSVEPFARARAQSRPVLLALAPSWCRHSGFIDEAAALDGGITSIVNTRFIPIRVDADRRPDIAERYSLGGWPTTAFLTPEGDLLGGGTYIGPERLASILAGVSSAFASNPNVRAALMERPSDSAQASDDDDLVAGVMAAFDEVHGGFGSSPKFPHVSPVRMCLAIYKETGSVVHRDAAVRTLDAMGWGALYDERDGGFFRCSQNADWGRPNDEKLLEVNACLLDLYVEAFEHLQHGRYLERAEDTLRYLQTWLADPVDAGWAGSQRADPVYYASNARIEPPPVDRTQYTDSNALMASAALRAGRVMNDPALSEFAIRSLERVAVSCYAPGAGMAHFHDGEPRVRGLLDDQIAMASAQLDAFEATGNIVYEMLAQELALYAATTMWDEEDGGFFDRAPIEADDVGLLRERRKPFAGNCAAAKVLKRLAHTSGKPRFAELADRTLAAIRPGAAEAGPLAADYVLAVTASGQ